MYPDYALIQLARERQQRILEAARLEALLRPGRVNIMPPQPSHAQPARLTFVRRLAAWLGHPAARHTVDSTVA